MNTSRAARMSLPSVTAAPARPMSLSVWAWPPASGGLSVGFTTAAALVHELMEAKDARRVLNLHRQLSRLNLLIIDELGFCRCPAPGRTGDHQLFDEWTEVFGAERLTGALLDRVTHHVHILEMNGESYRLKHSQDNAASQAPDDSEKSNSYQTGSLLPYSLVTSVTFPVNNICGLLC